MRHFTSFIVLLSALVLLPLAVADAAPKFNNSDLAYDLQRYSEALKALRKPAGRTAAALTKLAQVATRSGDARKAAELYGTAIQVAPENASLWLALAESLQSIEPANDQERRDNNEHAGAAAYKAALLTTDPALEAKALALAAGTLKNREYWRAALDAYKASLALVEDAQVRSAFVALKAEQGFRITDYSVDSNALQPRICIQFSEQLGGKSIDYGKFLSIDGKDPAAVRAEGQQLCAEGLVHGQRYTVQVREGLPSAIGEDLGKTSNLSIYVRDRSPAVRFSGRNYVLPNRGQQGIPVTSVNTDTVDIVVYRIGDRSLARRVLDGDIMAQYSGNQLDDLRNRDGVEAWSGTLAVPLKLNEEVTTAFPVAEVIPKLQAGVYVMSARPKGSTGEYWEQQATQWFVVSDLGLTALTGDDGINAFVRSLATAEPLAGVSVQLIAKNNDVLATATSDASGAVAFPAGLARGTGGSAPALLVAERKESGDAIDFGFLDLATSAFDLTDRGVGGRPAPGALDAYVFTERGVYRSDETVHLTTLLRDRKARAVSNIPLTMILSRPDGVEHKRLTLKDQGDGGTATPFVVPANAMTGTWRAAVYSDPERPAIGETSFLVEDYVPERMELTLTAGDTLLVPGTPGTVAAAGRYLYGPPAADLAIDGEVVVTAIESGLGAYKDYSFGLHDESVAPVRATLDGLPRTDGQGQASVPVILPPLPRASRLLQAQVLLRLKEPSGKTLERSVTLPIAPPNAVIGIRAVNAGGVDRGGTAEFDIVKLDPQGRPIAGAGLKWQLLKLDYSYQWFGRGGSWNYESIVTTSKVADGTIDVTADKPTRLAIPVNWGEYRLEIVSDDATPAISSRKFSAGWYGGNTADSPEVLRIGLDKPSYQVGDTAKLSIASDGAGKAVISVLRDGLISSREVAVPAGGTTVDLPVDEAMAPGAYVSAILYRPLDEVEKRMPSRAIGIQWVTVDSTSKTAKVTLDMPDKFASGAELLVPVKVDGLEAGESAHVVVAAVDVGILNLTNFRSPAPDGWYYGQRQLGVELRDLYGRLIDGMRAERGAARSGGDGGGLVTSANLPTVAPVALFSGLLKVGVDGIATAKLQVPEFNGSLRVMAVVWSKEKLGHAEKEVIVRDPVAMLVSGPRFLTLGDTAELTFDLHNVEAPAGDFRLTVQQTDGNGAQVGLIDQTIALAANQRVLQKAPLKAERLGASSYAVALTGPNGLNVTRSFGLEVKPPAGDIKRSTIQTVKAGGSLKISSAVFDGLIADRTKVTLTVGPSAPFDVPGLLAQLDRYPYGCAEQTTSRALPLLYLDEVATAAGVAPDQGVRDRVQQAVNRLFEMQDSGGSFGLWGPGTADMWLSAYVVDFLTRAKEQGYVMPESALTRALDRLQNSIAYASDFEKGGEDIAYALYVLARNNRAPIGDLRYYADTRLDRFATPLAQAQIGAALALLGDKTRAERVFDVALGQSVADTGNYRRDYGSSLRDGAAMLTLVSETGVRQDRAAQLAAILAQSRQSRTYTSTQEQAWMLLAARSLIEQGKEQSLMIGTTPVTGTYMKSFGASDLATELEVKNTGAADTQAVVTVIGEAATPEPAISKGFALQRSYYTLAGEPVSPADGAFTLKQNERLVVVLQVKELDGKTGRLLLVDRLSAGLEVENPRLVESGSISKLPWLTGLATVEHTEFRDDRFVAALDLGAQAAQGESAAAAQGEGAEEATDEGAEPAAAKVTADGGLMLAYIVRAVTPGRYLVPAAAVEDMYAPDRYARTGTATLTVTE